MIFMKLITMNYVWQLKIAISVPLTLIVDGVEEQVNAILEIWNMQVVLNLVLMGGFSEKECALIKSELAVFLILHQKYLFLYLGNRIYYTRISF